MKTTTNSRPKANQTSAKPAPQLAPRLLKYAEVAAHKLPLGSGEAVRCVFSKAAFGGKLPPKTCRPVVATAEPEGAVESLIRQVVNLRMFAHVSMKGARCSQDLWGQASHN